MQRLVYAPEVYAYIKTAKEVINISDDIISGTVTRRINAPSTANLVLQNRNKFYNGRLLPMDRIVIYLKKTKPVLVFSGYLDKVPYLQPTPKPIQIAATCTMKLLEFTYFDPTLPLVQSALARFVGAGPGMGALPQAQGGSFTFFDTNKSGGKGDKIQEVGFGRMLLWLINEVGGWPMDKVHILPLPPKWIDTAADLFLQIQEEEQANAETIKEVMKKLFTSSGTGGGGANGNTSTTGVTLTESQGEIASKIDEVIKRYQPSSPYVGLGKSFVSYGLADGIEPRFIAAIAGAESSFGMAGSGVSKHNGFGYGPGRELGSWDGGIKTVADHLKSDYINQGLTTVVEIRNKWAPDGAANDPQGLNSNWVNNVKKYMSDMGASPDGSIVVDVEQVGTSTAVTTRTRDTGASDTTVKFAPGALVKRSATGNWRGTQGPVEYIYALVLQLGSGYGSKREKESTGDKGNPNTCNYDHDTSVNNAYAIDITFPNRAAGDKAASLIYSMLKTVAKDIQGPQGDAATWGKRGGNVIFTTSDNIFRYQLIYRCGGTPCGGDHSSFIHLSCRSMLATTGNFTIGPEIGGLKSVTIAGGSNTASADEVSTPRSTGSGVSTGGGGDSKISVYIEAGHSPPRQGGYEGQTGASGEMAKNITLATKVKALLQGKSNIQVANTNGSTPTGNPDVYISIHHDDNVTGVSYPADWSVSKDGAATGKSEPNRYPASQGGTGTWVDPPRLNINTNDALKKASKALGTTLTSHLGSGYSTAGATRMQNYYGFYYSNAKACAIIEFPNGGGYNVDQKAQQIADAVVEFANSGEVTGGGSGADDDNSIAGRVMAALIRTAMYNNNGQGHGKIGYSSPGKRGVPLIEAQNANAAMDCSGFISNAMIEVGAPSSTSESTGSFIQRSQDAGLDNISKSTMSPGTLLIEGIRGGSGSSEHVGMFIGDDKVVHCSGGNKGPNIVQYSTSYFAGDSFQPYVDPFIGTTNLAGSQNSSTSGIGQSAQVFDSSQALNTIFNFPGNVLESISLRGQRALENDVKLLGVVSDIAQASQRSFASHPNGDFMAWFPDYFNVSGRNPYLLISENELIDCTIDLDDTPLATHVFLNGDITQQSVFGGSANPFLEKMIFGQYGVVTIEQAFLLDTFLINTDKANKKLSARDKSKTRSILGQNSATAFLNRYGARPHVVSNPAIRHPYLNFFIAYQTFQRKWAEQFQSTVEFTFMPELFPGTTVKIQGMNVNFYCEEVTHNFDYSSGFTTSASLMAPSTDNGSYNFGLALASAPFKVQDDSDLAGVKVKTATSAANRTASSARRVGSAITHLVNTNRRGSR